MLGPLPCGPISGAPLLPKLRGLFAEFLGNASPAGLGVLPPSTCVGLRYGCTMSDSGFSGHALRALRYLLSLRVAPPALRGGFASHAPPALAPGFPLPARPTRMRPHSSVIVQCRNLRLLSIGYASPPRLRPRLPQGRSALPWKPWISGQEDSHLFLATHSGILSSRPSTAPPGAASAGRQRSPTDALRASPGFGAMFQPRTFSARGLSASELLRTLLMHGCF